MTIGERGQVTIPKQLREKYGLLPNTDVEFVEQRGQVVLRRSRETPTVNLRRFVGFLDGMPADVDRFIDEIRGK